MLRNHIRSNSAGDSFRNKPEKVRFMILETDHELRNRSKKILFATEILHNSLCPHIYSS